jgi:hypothetical protein
LARSTNYEVPHYAVFFNLLPFHPSLVKIFSAPCSETPSAYVLPLMAVYVHNVKSPYKKSLLNSRHVFVERTTVKQVTAEHR